MPALEAATEETVSYTTMLMVHPAWHVLSRLGEAQILLPLFALASGWLWRREPWSPVLRDWWLSLGAVTLLTTASKIAFLGFGWGIASLDFTGFSGHSMFSAAILPVLGGLALHVRGRAGLGVMAGWALALAVAVSRVKVSAHSPSEALSGLLLGSMTSAWTLRRRRLDRLSIPHWMSALALAVLLSMPWVAPPSRTHDWVTRLSLALSGRSRPYTRADLHRKPAAFPSNQQRGAVLDFLHHGVGPCFAHAGQGPDHVADELPVGAHV